MENKISDEIAQKQIDVFLDYYEIDVDDIPEEDNRRVYRAALKKLKRAVMAGRLEFRDDGTILQRLKSGGTDIVYSEITGKAKIESGKYADVNNHKRMYALLGSLSGLGMNAIAQLKGVDLSAAECIGLVFSVV